ncbi:MAG: DMT family transporter [Paracoccus sp. (in: a-proteobacteria)]|nr:DMT family transporter [Paracoccus sp. (in: a-proteobacteria)]
MKIYQTVNRIMPASPFAQGLIWMGLSMGAFIAMSVGSREMAASMSIRQVLFFRALVGLAVILLVARKVFPEVAQMRSVPLHIARNVTHFTAQYFWTIGIVMLPLASVFALEFTMPLWVTLFAFLLLGERVSKARILATIGGFVGVLVIVRPGLGVVDPAAGLVLIAAAGYGLSLIMVKRLTQSCSPGAIVVWMILIQLPLGFLAALSDWRPVAAAAIPWALVAGVGALAAHFCQAQALRRLDASVVIPIDFLRVPMAAIVGYAFYAERIDLFVFLGGAIILLSNFQAVRAEQKAKRRA